MTVDKGPSPFIGYPEQGRRLLGKPKTGDNTARHGYGPPVFVLCGMNCVYCGRDLAGTYEDWLNIQVDHVIPWHMAKKGFDAKWIADKSNCVTCCAACNSFLNRFTVEESPPQTLEEFLDLRDRVLNAKKVKALQRHREDRAYWEKNIRP